MLVANIKIQNFNLSLKPLKHQRRLGLGQLVLLPTREGRDFFSLFGKGP